MSSRISIRRAGAVAAGGGLLILAGFMFDVAVLFVPGLAFALVGLLTPAWVALAANRLSVRRRLDTDRVVEGEPVAARIEISGKALLSPRVELVDPLAAASREPGQQTLTSRRAGTSIEVVAAFERRGRKRLDPPTLSVHDPLDLARVERLGSPRNQELLVLPRTEPIRPIADQDGAGARTLGGEPLLQAIAATEVDGLAPYRPGTPASRIHWPALARGAGLLERRLRPDSSSRPLVVLDPRCTGPASHFDAAVRAAASLALELGRRGGCGLLLPGHRRPVELDPGLRGWPAAHLQLALLEGDARAKPPPLSAALLAGPVVYVAAAPPERLLGTLAARRGMLVLPIGVPAPRPHPVIEVAGCHGFLLAGERRQARGRAA